MHPRQVPGVHCYIEKMFHYQEFFNVPERFGNAYRQAQIMRNLLPYSYSKLSEYRQQLLALAPFFSLEARHALFTLDELVADLAAEENTIEEREYDEARICGLKRLEQWPQFRDLKLEWGDVLTIEKAMAAPKTFVFQDVRCNAPDSDTIKVSGTYVSKTWAMMIKEVDVSLRPDNEFRVTKHPQHFDVEPFAYNPRGMEWLQGGLENSLSREQRLHWLTTAPADISNDENNQFAHLNEAHALLSKFLDKDLIDETAFGDLTSFPKRMRPVIRCLRELHQEIARLIRAREKLSQQYRSDHPVARLPRIKIGQTVEVGKVRLKVTGIERKKRTLCLRGNALFSDGSLSSGEQELRVDEWDYSKIRVR